MEYSYLRHPQTLSSLLTPARRYLVFGRPNYFLRPEALRGAINVYVAATTLYGELQILLTAR